MQARTLGAWSSFATQLAAGAAFVVWPQHTWLAAAIFGASTLILLFILIKWFLQNYRIVFPIQKLKSSIVISVDDVVFDPNGPTELYIDCTVSNRGYPTILKNWSAHIRDPSGKSSVLHPRHLHTATLRRNAFGQIQHEDYRNSPLQTGESFTGRLVFTVEGPTPRERFGRAGTYFEICGEDVRERRFAACFTLAKTASPSAP
jgi:hypothetical protein